MRKRGPRQTLFVCSSIMTTGFGKPELISKVVTAETRAIACQEFKKEHGLDPETVLGPFFQKKTGVLNSDVTIQFSGVTKKAIYNGWHVKAMMLALPEGYAYLFYDKRTDDKKIQKPTSGLVKIEELKSLQ